MESYPSTGTATVRSFMSSWTTELHGLGYSSGEYSSLDSGITVLVSAPAGYTEPDMIDFAVWDGNASTTNPTIPSADWTTHQRIHQYSGGTEHTYGGVQIDVDQDYMDVAVAAPVPVLPTAQPAVLKNSNGTLDLYRVRSDSDVWGDGQSGGAFTGWQPLSAAINFAGTPLATSQHVRYGPFDPWSQIGSATDLVSDPAALITAAGTVAIFAADSSAGVSEISQSVPDGPFGSWTEI